MRISKFRNDPELNVELEMRGIILFSMLSIPSLSYHLTAEQMLLKVNSINLQANMQIILYEVVKG